MAIYIPGPNNELIRAEPPDTSSRFPIVASYADTAGYSETASYALNGGGGGTIINISGSGSVIIAGDYVVTSSTALNNRTASYAQSALTASYARTSLTSSYSETSSFVQLAQSSLTSTNSTSASYSVSASYAPSSIDVSAFATTGSNVFKGNQTISGSFNVTGSAVHIGDLSVTGSFRLTGSVIQIGDRNFIGNTMLSGSLNMSGSTTQVGNNNLLGNTTLSGSIIISGSVGSALPSIRIFGNSQIDGYMRFDPTNNATINQSISASYIFSSGSTGDLYFSENADGVNNVVRLRWFEGNLYSGLLNGGIISQSSSTTYRVSSGSGIIVNLGATISADPRPTIQYLKWSNLSSSIAAFSASSDNTYVAVQAGGTIYEQATPFADGQYDTLIPIGLIIHNNHSTINAVKTRPSLGYGFKQRQTVFTQAFGPLKLSGMVLSVSGSSTGSLIVGSGTCYVDGGNYQTDPNNPSYITDTGTNTSKIFRYYQTGSQWVYGTNGGAGYGTIDPTQYSLNGTLTAVPGTGVNRQWSIQRVFWFPKTATGAIIVYYGNATYLTKTDAVANIPFESFNEAFNTAENAVYIGALVVRNNADFTDVASYGIQPGGLFRSVGGSGGGTAVTSPLSGLSDVSITSPSNGQPLVYNSSTVKWENSSVLTASLYGSSTTSVTASYAVTASYVSGSSTTSVTSSYALTASYVQNVISASYAVTASYLPFLSTQNDLGSGTALSINTNYYVTLNNSRTLTFSGASASGDWIDLKITSTNTSSLTFPQSVRLGTSGTTTVLNLISGSFYELTWQYVDSKWWLADSVGDLAATASYAITASYAFKRWWSRINCFSRSFCESKFSRIHHGQCNQTVRFFKFLCSGKSRFIGKCGSCWHRYHGCWIK